MATRKTKQPPPPTQPYGPPLAPNPDDYLNRIQQNIAGLSQALDKLQTALGTPQPLTAAQLSQASKALAAGGESPLNLTNLVGTVAGAVESLNGLVKAITLAAGTGLTVTVSGQTIKVSIATVISPGTTTPVHSITVNAEGQITAIS
jgi:hypothetical protein